MKHGLVAVLVSCTINCVSAAPFCAWKIPLETKPERWINLTVVQYIDLGDEEVKISFGGGNLGSGYDAKIPVKSRDEAAKILKSMQDSAKLCEK